MPKVHAISEFLRIDRCRRGRARSQRRQSASRADVPDAGRDPSGRGARQRQASTRWTTALPEAEAFADQRRPLRRHRH